MAKRIQGIIIGILATVILLGGTALALTGTQSINVTYRDIKMVVNGQLITPTDAQGNVVEPFIYNGTTYLPVRAVSEALGQEVSWDGDTSTVYIGGVVDRPAVATDIALWNRPFIAVSPSTMYAPRESRGDNFIVFQAGYVAAGDYESTQLEGNKHIFTPYVTFPLNGLAVNVRGTFMPPGSSAAAEHEVVYKFFDENDRLLYQSPIMISTTSEIPFEFSPGNSLVLKCVMEVTHHVQYWTPGIREVSIKNLVVTMMDDSN